MTLKYLHPPESTLVTCRQTSLIVKAFTDSKFLKQTMRQADITDLLSQEVQGDVTIDIQSPMLTNNIPSITGTNIQ
jgi:hypothetical protein